MSKSQFRKKSIEQGVGRAGTIAKTQTVYGAYGLPEKVIQPDGSAAYFRYNPLWKGNDEMLYLKKTIVDPRGVVTEELFDANEQQRDICVKNILGQIVSHRATSVNILGKPVIIGDDVIVDGTISQTIRTVLEYDSAGQLTTCIFAANTPDQAMYRYVYDACGRKVQDIKPSGVILFSFYDSKGRLIKISSSDGSVDYRYFYNIQGLPEKIINAVSEHATFRTYDGLGHLVGERFENDLAISYDVDISGRLKSITYPDETTTVYSYRYGLLSTILRKDYLYRVQDRDLSGCITSSLLPENAGLLTQAVDIMGRRRLIEHPACTEERTAFDLVGNCIERSIDGKQELFSYDALCQLTSDAGKSVSFDSLNRRLQSNGIVSKHNARHQMVVLGGEQFYYDVDGRRIKDATSTYTYDALDRLISIEDGSVRVSFEYDAFNRRMSCSSQEAGGNAKHMFFLWQQNCEIGSYFNNAMQSLRLLGEGLGGEIGAAVAYEINDELLIPIHDLCGNVRVCLNRYGDVVERICYNSFGSESSTIGLSPWTFASKRQEPHFNLIFFGQRFYDPRTSTWLTQDPVGLSAGPNLYAYVKNNPLMLVDVFGLFDLSCVTDFLSSAWNLICDVVHEVGDGVLDCCSYVASSTREQLSLWIEPSSEVESITFKDGTKVCAHTRWGDAVLVYPDGSIDFFVANHRGENLGKNVYVYSNGILTRPYEAVKRCEKFMKEYEEIIAVIILYNTTQGLIADLCETMSILCGRETEVENTLKTGLCHLLDQCKENNIHFESTFINHSQGVAITRGILEKCEFQPGGAYAGHVYRSLNFGGPIFVPHSQNFLALGDPVSFLAMANLVAFASMLWNNEITFCYPTRLEFPHNFLGSAYQSALEGYMSSRKD